MSRIRNIISTLKALWRVAERLAGEEKSPQETWLLSLQLVDGRWTNIALCGDLTALCMAFSQGAYSIPGEQLYIDHQLITSNSAVLVLQPIDIVSVSVSGLRITLAGRGLMMETIVGTTHVLNAIVQLIVPETVQLRTTIATEIFERQG